MRSYSGDEGSWHRAPRLYLRAGRGQGQQAFKVREVRPHKGFLLVQLQGVATIEDAERLRGAEVFVEKAGLTKADGEFFWYEIIDLRVFSATQEYLGKVTDIIRTGSNDVYVVREGDREILIPAVEEVVKEIDLKGGKMIVSPLGGLLESNEV